jgi:nitrite reductase/ring-hydroxylating ferredoxin subunit
VQRIAAVADIGPQGLKFPYRDGPFEDSGILVRLADGTIRAFKNECRHLPMALDAREPKELWDAEGQHLVCNSHGALYRPEDGLCVRGPCQGSHLHTLPIVVRDAVVFLDTSKLAKFSGV